MNKSDDEIEVLATDVIEDVKPRRSSATKKVKKQEGVCMRERERWGRDPSLYIRHQFIDSMIFHCSSTFVD